uniref:Lysosomal-associated transmembrane protein 4A n=1 Tax=Phallusia mammillata TaxID=59560 RepID=A0A6F9DKF4_9ASCI|nr:lysosomal-associated transmembrane protein 4A [Phallusia mammillata]
MFIEVKGIVFFLLSLDTVCSTVLHSDDVCFPGLTTRYCGTEKCQIVEPLKLSRCCKKQEVMKCCTMYELLHATDYTVITTVALSKPIHPQLSNAVTHAPGLSIVSFGVGATVGVIIGLIMLFIGCGIAFHYCCQRPIPSGYHSPVISYRQTGLRGRNSQVISIPWEPTRRGSHVNISINCQGIHTVSFRSTPEQTPCDEPPKYEDVSKVSFPVHLEEQPLTNQDLPTYASIVSREDP